MTEEFTIDWDRVQPLRVSQGSHQEGSGKGCAMNIVSYVTGEKKITDYPKCSARPLARMVQMVNDRLAAPVLGGFPGGFLSPENALIAIELGMLTVGTADASEDVVRQWTADLLVDEQFGLISHFASQKQRQLISAVADHVLHPEPSYRKLAEIEAEFNNELLTSVQMRCLYVAEDLLDSCATLEYQVTRASDASVDVLGAEMFLPDVNKQPMINGARAVIRHWRDLMGLETVAPVDHEVLNGKVFI